MKKTVCFALLFFTFVACSTQPSSSQTDEVEKTSNNITVTIFPTSTPREVGMGYNCPERMISELPANAPIIIIQDDNSVYQLGNISIYSDGKIEFNNDHTIQVDSNCVNHLLMTIDIVTNEFATEVLETPQKSDENYSTIKFFAPDKEEFQSIFFDSDDMQSNPHLDSLIRQLNIFMEEAKLYGT